MSSGSSAHTREHVCGLFKCGLPLRRQAPARCPLVGTWQCRAFRSRPTATQRCAARAAAAAGGDRLPAKASKNSLRNLKKDQLASILRSVQLSDAGLKPELIERLYAALQSPASLQAPASDDSAPAAHANEQLAPSSSAPLLEPEDPAQQPVPANTASAAPAEAQQRSAEAQLQPQPIDAGRLAQTHDSQPDGAYVAAEASTTDGAAARPPVSRRVRAVGPAAAAASAAPPPATASQAPLAARPECRVPTGLAVQWLGTSSGSPTLHRNVSSIMFMQQHRVMMVDCGEGTINQLAAAGVDPVLVQGVFITHMHGDHIFGLPGLLRAISARHLEMGTAQPETVRIFGPPGTQDLLRAGLSATMSQLVMPIVITEFTTDPAAVSPHAQRAPGITCAVQGPDIQPPQQLQGLFQRWEDADLHTVRRLGNPQNGSPLTGLTWRLAAGPGVTVTAAPLSHRLPCWGYVFQEVPQMADVDPQRLQALVSRRLDEQHVQTGQPIVLPDGMQVPAQQLQMMVPGRKIVLLGDTCNSAAIAGPAANADLLSHECTFSDEEEEKAAIAMHSTASMAGTFAAQLRVGRLVLTHFSGRYKTGGRTNVGAGNVVEANSNTQAYLAHQARMAFGVPAQSPRVMVAQDFLKVDVPRRQPRAHGQQRPPQQLGHQHPEQQQRRQAQQLQRQQLVGAQ